MALPKKYKDIDFTPPKAVQAEAEKGLKLRSEFKRGGTQVGVARARDLKGGKAISPDTIHRMTSYFARHAVDRKAKDFGKDDDPSAGYVAWLLWGGDAGRDWAGKVAGQMDDADKN